MKIINVVGARPNFMKIAPLIDEMKKRGNIDYKLVHTGQHYDKNMSKLFFDDLNLPKPDIFLGIGSSSHAEQTAKIMIEFERILIAQTPDLVLVVGDVNSTIACALTAVKLHIPVAHVEAGLRSFDRSMPEEVNRVLTDSISDYLFTTEKSAQANLIKEGVPEDKIFFVGNVMIDSLLKHREKANNSQILDDLQLQPENYAVVTLHRPANVDNKEDLMNMLEVLEQVSKHIRIVYPVHPRTKQKIDLYKLNNKIKDNNIQMIDPVGYLDFIKLLSNARIVLTDSGGIQEETTVLGVPCVTLRDNTERPITISEGTNLLAGTKKDKIIKETLRVLDSKVEFGKKVPEKWDGKAAKRIVDILIEKIK